MTSGIFTKMLGRKPEIDADLEGVAEAAAPLSALADLCGWPEIWIVCHICGAQSWRIPPHVFDPCPLAIEIAESQQLKTDAERSTAIRMGVNLETQARAVEQFLDQLRGDEEE